eukprot:scaffold21230_cov60-Phaeocystis_antarctica.AAC.2
MRGALCLDQKRDTVGNKRPLQLAKDSLAVSCEVPTRLRRETPVSCPAYSQVPPRQHPASSWLPTWRPGG